MSCRVRCIMVLCVGLLGSGSLRANEAGDWLVQVGWFLITPQESSEPLRTELAPSVLGAVLGIEPSFSSPGTSASVSDSNTPALTLSYFFTDHWALKLEGGLPAEFDLHGEGVVRPTGIAGSLINVDLGAAEHQPLASARQWSPAALLQYYFFDPSLRLRPYLGVGATYTWFTDIELNPAFEQDVRRNFGAPLALATGSPGPVWVSGDASSSWAPIVNAGLSYGLDERWGVSLSVSTIALRTTSTIKLDADDGTALARSSTRIKLNPVVASLLLSYRFGG